MIPWTGNWLFLGGGDKNAKRHGTARAGGGVRLAVNRSGKMLSNPGGKKKGGGGLSPNASVGEKESKREKKKKRNRTGP